MFVSFNKSLKYAVVLALGATAVNASGKDKDLKETRLAAANLQSELSSLDSEEIKAKANDKMFVVQDRHVDLTNSFQLAVGGGKTVNPNIYLDSDETMMSLRYYFNNMFFAQLDGSKVNTDLTTSGERAWRNDGIYPDTTFVESRYGGSLGINLLYGKVRVTQSFVFYFDQFLTVGGGMLEQNNGLEKSKVPALMGEAGFSFGLGRRFSLLVGVRDTYYEERRRSSTSNVHQVVAYSGLGMVLGGQAL